LDRWLQEEAGRAEAALLRNVSPEGAMRGAIIASPSRASPDYDYHWVRDSGIVAKALIHLYLRAARSSAARRRYLGLLMDFASFSRHIQRTAVEHGSGLGEPKFTVDGEPYKGPWARPQHDGPAIRALVLTHLAFVLLDEGEQDLVRERLYDGKLLTDSVIKTDLEYLARVVGQPCFDCWEEVRGHHFFTQLLVHNALRQGAFLAMRLGDLGAARFYLDRAAILESPLRSHWDPQRGYLVATPDPTEGPDEPRSGLDSSTIVATLGAYSVADVHTDNLYPVEHEQVLATAAALESTFAALFPINDPSRNIPGIAMGRYPEDHYDGYRRGAYGNPWPSLTCAFALFHHKLARRYLGSGRIEVTPASLPFFRGLGAGAACVRAGDTLVQGNPCFGELIAALRRRGDAFLARVSHHARADGSLSEQTNRVTGFQQGARDLSMSYAALLLAAGARS
jgi:glucoamylase